MPNPGMRANVPPIPVRPSLHGLLSGCIDIVSDPDVHELNGTQTLASGCTPARGWQDCPDPSGRWTNPPAKLFDRIEWCSFDPISATAGVECSTFGINQAEAEQAALAALELREQNVLESFWLTNFLTDATHTVDITPVGGALHIVNGIGALEQWLDDNFGGQGVLHLPVGAATLLSMHHIAGADEQGGCLETLAGNTVVLGGGYSANLGPALPPALPAAAPDGELWVYITPAMRIRRDSREIVPPTERASINIMTNDRRVMAETTFVPEVACCIAAAVRVSLSACC